MVAAQGKIEPPIAAPALPLVLTQHASRGGTVAAGTFIAVAAAVLLAPFSLLAAGAAHAPDSVASTIMQPVVAVQLGLALIVALTFVAVPLHRLLKASRRPARIVVAADQVAATDATGRALWTEPLASYRGIAHHIRTSLSGARHEIVLVHATADKTVVIETGDRIGQARIDTFAGLLRLPEVPAGTLYQRRAPDQWMTSAEVELKAA